MKNPVSGSPRQSIRNSLDNVLPKVWALLCPPYRDLWVSPPALSIAWNTRSICYDRLTKLDALYTRMRAANSGAIHPGPEILRLMCLARSRRQNENLCLWMMYLPACTSQPARHFGSYTTVIQVKLITCRRMQSMPTC